MKKSFLEFVSEKKTNTEYRRIISEALKNEDLENGLKLIDLLLKKHISGLIVLDGFVDTSIDGNECFSHQYLVCKDKSDFSKVSLFQLNWLNSGKSNSVYSVDFFKNADVYWKGEGKSDLSIYTLGTSIVRFLPIIWTVVNDEDYSLSNSDAEQLSNKIFNVKESRYSVGKLDYIIYEGMKQNMVVDAFMLESEASNYRKEKSLEIGKAIRNNAPQETIDNLRNEYLKICKAINDGAETVAQIKMAIEKGKFVKDNTNYSKIEKENVNSNNKGRKDPEQVFKEMSKYIALVIKGLQPSLILCGAPGVGKTYRVKTQLKNGNYDEGKNLCTLKGKCTARKLYLSLYEYKDKNDIVLIDDADSLVGPKADENCINILKAALDSSSEPEGRLVTYGIAGKLTDDDGREIPKKFYFKGGVIVITNYRAGSLDTALRNRSFIQDIDFTNEEVLDIIKKLLPNIENGILDTKSKMKALDYLNKLNKEGSDMELSLRTFVLCAKIFKACDGDSDFTDEDAESMIAEQMRLQYARGRGEKY